MFTLEKFKKIKQKINESSDALCSLCQVAPCGCHKGNHIDESAEQLDEMTQGKSYTQAQLHKKIQSGHWEATHDIKPGKHVEMRHHTGKRVMVHVKEDTEQLDEISSELAQKVSSARLKRVMNDPQNQSAHDKFKRASNSSMKRIDRDMTKNPEKTNKGYASDADKNTKRGWSNESVDSVEINQLKEESRHRVAVTVSEPDHPAVSMRKATKQKFVKVSASSKEEAVKKAHMHYKKAGYKVHGAEYHSELKEDVEQLDELSKETLRSYKHKAELSVPKDDREYKNRSKGIESAEKKMKTEACGSYKSMKKEELKGDQHKLDKNKNGKIDKHDFKLLRKEHAHPLDEFTLEEIEEFMQTEDYQQLDELSKKTLGSYVKKANQSAMSAAYAVGSKRGAASDDHINKMFKRKAGVNKATDRLTKEETVQEGSYPGKAAHQPFNGEKLEPRAPAEKAFKDKHSVQTFNRPDKDPDQDGADKVKPATPPGTVTDKGDKNIVKPIKSFKSFIKTSDI